MFDIRLASETDLPALYSLDPLAQTAEERRSFLRRVVAAGNCYVALEEQILGYVVLEYSFFENGFVSMLVVDAGARRKGVGERLMRHCEAVCRTPKLFTSTNLSNLPMQALLAKLGYKLSGVIQDLDVGDPELVFVKYLGGDQT